MGTMQQVPPHWPSISKLQPQQLHCVKTEQKPPHKSLVEWHAMHSLTLELCHQITQHLRHTQLTWWRIPNHYGLYFDFSYCQHNCTVLSLCNGVYYSVGCILNKAVIGLLLMRDERLGTEKTDRKLKYFFKNSHVTLYLGDQTQVWEPENPTLLLKDECWFDASIEILC